MFDASSERSLESLALGVGAVSFVLVALISLIAFQFQAAPISGPGSVGQFAAIASGVVAFLAVIAGRIVVHRHEGADRLRVLDYIDVAALAFAHGVIALLGWTLLAVILEQAFIGATVFALPVLLLAGATAAMTGYLAFYSATHMDLQLLAVVLAVFLVFGVLASMLTASDPDWWKDNLSALGMSSNVSAFAFNITIIVAGFLVTTLARYSTRGIPTENPKGIGRVRVTLIVLGVFLGLVGVFPVDQFFALHTGVASGMVAAFGVLVIALPKWITGISRAFVVLGWLFLAVTLLLAVFFFIGYYTLTAVELVAGILVFTWIVLFIRNAGALQQDSRQAASAD
ncbi:hypothetical protein ASF40_02675 [Microbacterium sp. Leaf288]|nr:hypothetical protein ASF40_02675 [Microbacterium sp. Leaf288]